MKQLHLIGPKVAPLLLAAVLPLVAVRAQAQVVTAGPDSARVALAPPRPAADSLLKTERLFGRPVTRPHKAFVLALMLPGAGQVYNHRYWKVPLALGAVGGTVYGEAFYWSRYREFREGYRNRNLRRQAQTAGLSQDVIESYYDTGTHSSVYPNTSEGDAQQSRVLSAYRTRRDTFFAYIALAYGVQALDALVDAHLYNFDIGEDLSLRTGPTLLPNVASGIPAPGMAFTLTLRPPASGRGR